MYICNFYFQGKACGKSDCIIILVIYSLFSSGGPTDILTLEEGKRLIFDIDHALRFFMLNERKKIEILLVISLINSNKSWLLNSVWTTLHNK